MKRLELAQLPHSFHFWSPSGRGWVRVNALGSVMLTRTVPVHLVLISLSELLRSGERYCWVPELWFIAPQMGCTLPLEDINLARLRLIRQRVEK